MPATASNAINISAQGTVYFNGTATFSGIDGSTSGFVLTSNGTGVAPSFQINPGNIVSNSVVNISDDFIGAQAQNTGVTMVSKIAWLNGIANTAWQTTSGVSATSNAHPGILQNNSMTSSIGHQANYLVASNGTAGSSTGENIILGGGAITLNWVVKIITASNSTNRYIFRMGLSDINEAITDASNGVYFEYSDNINSGQWTIKTANGGTRTTTNTTTAQDTSYHNFQIAINAAATSVTFSIDGSSVGTISTNIPTSNPVNIFCGMVCTAGTIAAASAEIDLMYFIQNLTTAR